jgi:deubiquitinase DESI2
MGTAVCVNVYDLGDFNGYIGWLGVGVFHSGVEVLGKEFAFGGAPSAILV